MATYLMVDDAVKKIRRPVSMSSISFDELKKRWLKASLNCDFETLKKCYCEDETLLNKKDHFTGYALIHWVSKKGRLDILRWLIQNKADLNNRTNGGHTALHIATIHGNEPIINKLIHEFDADITLRDYSGRTPRQYLQSDSSVSIQRALNCVPSALLSKSDTPISPRPIGNRTLPSSLSMPAIFGESSTDNNNNNNNNLEAGPKKKRVLSISQSFKRGKKVLVSKRDQTDNVSQSKSPSENDTFESTNDNHLYVRKKPSFRITHPHFHESPTTPSMLPLHNPHSERRASENMVNGYAGFINNNKYHSKTPEESTVSKQQWSINTWV